MKFLFSNFFIFFYFFTSHWIISIFQEMEEKKQQALISAVQQAQAQAELEKKSKKIQKLIPLQCENSDTQHSCKKKSDDTTSVNSLTSNMETKLKIEGMVFYLGNKKFCESLFVLCFSV